MFISIDLQDPTPAYLQITEAVRRAIATGALQAGDRLPPIREAAVQTRVNRNTVSRAYLELEHQGLVVARQGSGYYVTNHGAQVERTVRREALEAQARELMVEARLSGTSTDELVSMLRQCDQELSRGDTTPDGKPTSGPEEEGNHV